MGKKHKHIFDDVCTFDNLYSAYRKARKGKRQKAEVSDFEFDLESNLFKLQDDLKSGSFRFGGYRTFTITDPKERTISAAPFRDRVVHHALCNYIEPILDKVLLPETYACRYGKGSHRAISKAIGYVRKYKYVLKVDIKKYFFTIDHEILLSKLQKKITDKRIIGMFRDLLGTYDSGEDYYFGFEGDNLFDCARSKGLPIGNLTSQLFANFYLNDIDRLIKEDLKIKGYVRYMDDLLIFADTKEELREVKTSLASLLKECRLNLNNKKTYIIDLKDGIAYLGFHIYKERIKILRGNLKRFEHRMREKSRLLGTGDIEFDSILLSLNSWLGFIGKERYKGIVNKILDNIKFKRVEEKIEFSFCV